MLPGHGRGITCLQYRGDHVVSSSSDKTIKVWSVPRKVCLRTLVGHTALVRCVRFDSTRIVSGSYDKTIRVSPLLCDCDTMLRQLVPCMLAPREEEEGGKGETCCQLPRTPSTFVFRVTGRSAVVHFQKPTRVCLAPMRRSSRCGISRPGCCSVCSRATATGCIACRSMSARLLAAGTTTRFACGISLRGSWLTRYMIARCRRSRAVMLLLSQAWPVYTFLGFVPKDMHASPAHALILWAHAAVPACPAKREACCRPEVPNARRHQCSATFASKHARVAAAAR